MGGSGILHHRQRFQLSRFIRGSPWFHHRLLGGCNGSGSALSRRRTGLDTQYLLWSVGQGQRFTRAQDRQSTTSEQWDRFRHRVDSNGNKITVSGSTFTDTLVHALTISGQGSSTSPLQFQYTSPHGTPASVTLNYTLYNVKTAFACSGISEYSQNSISLVSSVSLPDNTSYSINYEADSKQLRLRDGTHFSRLRFRRVGRLHTLTATGATNRLPDGSTATLTRRRRTERGNNQHSESGTAWTTLITDPQSTTNIIFQGNTKRSARFTGSTSGTLLKTLITCYNGNTTNCNSTDYSANLSTYVTAMAGDGGKQSKVNTLYNGFGLVTRNRRIRLWQRLRHRDLPFDRL